MEYFMMRQDPRVLVRLDVAESILRRYPYGVWFERIRVMTRGFHYERPIDV
jgi:hypothetical protein